MSIYKLKPACKDYIWGGTKLKNAYQKQSPAPIIAETWELSCHPDGQSVLEKTGTSLNEHLQNKPEAMGTVCKNFEEFPVLIKLIDAAKDLSIQVHPDNEYAKLHENQLGKTEMWYIVDCDEGASLYYGFAQEISKEEFASAIQNNTLCEKLHKVTVQKGDMFFIEAGTIHAIGAGCLIAEVQQNSNVTYRVYDYGRVGADGNPRELHVQQALDVTLTKPAKTDYNFGTHLAKCDYFTVDKVCIDGEIVLNANESSFQSLLFLEGTATVQHEDESIYVQKGDSIFIDANSGNYTIKGNATALLTYVE